MRLKLTLGDGPGERDLLITADGTATIGAVAEQVALVTGTTVSGSPVTIRSHGVPSGARPEAPEVLDPTLPVAESTLRSGVKITLCAASQDFRSGAASGEAAVLRVLEGPDAGAEFRLPFGSSYVGREKGCDVVLRDGFVSKRHVRVSITDAIEVVDLGSANGMTVDGESIQRATVRPEDRIGLGDSVVSITPLVRFSAQSNAAVGFNRPPWVASAYDGAEVELPEPTTAVRGMRFPIIAMMAPLLIGAVLIGLGQPKTSLIFIALSPVLMAGSFADQWRQSRAEQKASRRRFDEMVDQVREELTHEHALERDSRLREHPSTAETTVAVEELSGLLWSRRPDMPGFLGVRLGLGAVASRTPLKMPSRRRASAEEWATLSSIRDDFTLVTDVPVVADLSQSGGVGVAGPEAVMAGVARSLVLQLVGLHSDAELAVVAVGSSSSVTAWDWLKWLPHVGSAHGPLRDPTLANNAGSGLRLISQLEELISDRTGDSTFATEQPAMLPAVLVVVLDDAPVERSRLVQIAERGPAAGVHVLWCAHSLAQLPAACRSFVELPAEGAGTVGLVHRGEEVRQVVCEFADEAVALHVARRLSPLVDVGAKVADDSDLPRSVSFLGVLGTDLGSSSTAVLERWQANDPTLASGGRPRKEPLSLRAVVGQGAADSFALDLRVHGPHALVGGTTGAGKSEFLQSWVLGMASSQSPKRVTFLFVDYKGGSAFATCTELPHCVGLVTDLSPHLVRRALTSLRAELTYREEVLREHGVKDLIELEAKHDAPQLPSLIIVVDEFAALVQEVPEFIDGVIDVAQRGRSLGLHLVLATQRPSGVITGSLRSNTNLRVALRMSDNDDSVDILGDAMAAGFDPGIPGRAAAKTGPGRISPFQSLYVGGVTADQQPKPDIVVETCSFGGNQVLLPPTGAVPPSTPAREDAATDLDRVVEQITMAHRRLELPAPRRPWMDVLAPVYDWSLLGQRRDSELVIGVQDQPQRQTTRIVHFRPDIDGNMAIYGTGGSGKSTLLRTLATSAAVTPRSGPCDVYALDFASRGLSMLEPFSHVGAVIAGTDQERVGRLFRWLRAEVEDRSRRFSAANAANITEYRAAPTGIPDERRLLVLVDGFTAFRQEYEIGPRSAWYTLFGQLAADGRAIGIHFVIAADRPGAVPPSLAATIQRRIVLRLSDTNDYALAGISSDILNEESAPGRGVMDGYEVQVAVLGASAGLPQQVDAARKLQASLDRAGRHRARPIERLPDRIPLSDLPNVPGDRVAVGIDDESLSTFAIEPRGFFLVVGPPSSGRTTSLATLVKAVRQRHDRMPSFLFSSSRSALLSIDDWSGVATDDDAAAALAERIEKDILARPHDPTGGVLVIEALHSYTGSLCESSLESLVKLAAEHGYLVLGESETSALSQAWGLGTAFKAARRGMALQPDEMDGQSVFKTNFPRSVRSEFPPGRGVVVDAGQTTRVQICLPE